MSETAGANETVWKVCSICKKALPYASKHYICSVSTCQRKRTGLVFCSPQCFDAHLPMMRHRDAWAEENTAPTRQQVLAEAEAERAVERRASSAADENKRRIVTTAAVSAANTTSSSEVLVVISKLKKFIREQSGMNTSDGVTSVLSRHLRELSVQALRTAAADGRRTVLERDFEAVLQKLSDSR